MAVPALQPEPKTAIAAINVIPGDPAGWDILIKGSRQHLTGELRLAGKADTVGNPGLATALTILRPGLWQVAFAVDKSTTAVAGVTEKHANLAILDTSRRIDAARRQNASFS